MTMWISYEISSITVAVLLQTIMCVNTSFIGKRKQESLFCSFIWAFAFHLVMINSGQWHHCSLGSSLLSCIYSHLFPCLFNQLGIMWRVFHVHSIMYISGKICMFTISLAVKTLDSFIEHIAPLNLIPKHWKLPYSGVSWHIKIVVKLNSSNT